MVALVQSMPRKKRNDEPVKVDAEVLRMARIISAVDGVALAELLSETLRPILKRRLEDIQAKGFTDQPPKRPRK